MEGRGINRTGAIGVALALALTACAGSLPERAGERADDAAPTFVSLNPCLDAILVEVAEPDQVLALSHFSRDPAASSMDPARAAEFGVTGGTAEEVIALAPDVVLASSFIDPATKSALERAGMRVETFGSPSSVAESTGQVRRLAELVGESQGGDALIAVMEHSRWPPPVLTPTIAEPQKRPRDPSVLLWQAGEIVPGEETLIAQLLRESGFADHAAAIGLSQADRVSLEQVLANPPDLLLVAGDSAGQAHRVLQELDQTLVHAFDPRLFYCGGPSIPLARSELLELRTAFVPHRNPH